MAQSLSNILLHVVFSTKNRRSWINIELDEELAKYMAGICRELGCPSHKIGGTDDHVHIACSISRTITVSKLIQEIKTGSSKWIKTKGDRYAEFAWQNGYGAFSIGQSQRDDLIRYISKQRMHHTRETFQEEFRALLAKYQVEFDEQYVWD